MIRSSRFFKTCFFVVVFMCYACLTFSAMTSTNYAIPSDTIASGGGIIASASFSNQGAIGQAGPVGMIGQNSDDYLALTGFFATVPMSLDDPDGDGVINVVDAFPLDPAASVDSDGDGYPDSWNNGYSQGDSTTGLALDAYPDDPDYWASPLTDTTAFVMQVYQDFLNRDPDAGGLAYWVDAIDNQGVPRAQLVENFIYSAEFGQTVAPVTRLYFAYFNRIPDYNGLMYWINSYAEGTELSAISDAFAGSAEFIATYGSLDNSAFVTLVYQNVLGRDPDTGGLSYWTSVLDNSEQTRGQVMIGFSESTEYQDLMANQIYVTMTYIGLLRRSPDQGGFDYWVSVMDGGGSGLGLIEGFLTSSEYAARFEVPPVAGSAPMIAEANSESIPLQFAYPYHLLQEQTQQDQTADGQYDSLETIDYNYDSQSRYSGHQILTDLNRDGETDASTTITLSYNSAGNPDISLKQQDFNNDGEIDQTSRQRYLYDNNNQLIGYIEEQQDTEGQYQTLQTVAHSYENNQLQSTTIIHDRNQDGEIDQTQIHYSYDSDGFLISETTGIDNSQDGTLDASTTTTYNYSQGRLTEQAIISDSDGDTQIDQYTTIIYSYSDNQLVQIIIEQDSNNDSSIDAITTTNISYAGSDPMELVTTTDSDNDGTIDQSSQLSLSFTSAGYQLNRLPISPALPASVPLESLLLKLRIL